MARMTIREKREQRRAAMARANQFCSNYMAANPRATNKQVQAAWADLAQSGPHRRKPVVFQFAHRLAPAAGIAEPSGTGEAVQQHNSVGLEQASIKLRGGRLHTCAAVGPQRLGFGVPCIECNGP